MRSAQLLGRNHTDEGRIACVAEARAGIAISRGGAPKPYPCKEPNEDAVCFAHGPAGTLLAVADGHAGAEAAQLALRLLLEDPAPTWTQTGLSRSEWPGTAEALVTNVHTHIVRLGAKHGSEARTTFSVAWVQPDASFCGWASVGDSHVFSVGADAREHGPSPEPVVFVGSPRRQTTELALRSGSVDLGGLRAIVLATDGLSERGIGVANASEAAARAVANAAAESVPRRPLAAARSLVDIALAAQRQQRAGDNIATAVCWLERA